MEALNRDAVARCAACFTLDMDAESLFYLTLPQKAHPMTVAASMLRYGPDVAVPRILDTYRHYGIRQTILLPGWCAKRYPYAIEAMVRDGHEASAHGYLHEHLAPVRGTASRGGHRRARACLRREWYPEPRATSRPSRCRPFPM